MTTAADELRTAADKLRDSCGHLLVECGYIRPALADLLDDQADGDDEGVINPWALAVARAINGGEQQ